MRRKAVSPRKTATKRRCPKPKSIESILVNLDELMYNELIERVKMERRLREVYKPAILETLSSQMRIIELFESGSTIPHV